MVIYGYGVGLILGALLSGTALWTVGSLVPPVPRYAMLSVLFLAGFAVVLRDLKVLRFPLPQNARLVPFTVFQRLEVLAALQFGFEMGTGVRTFVTASGPYLLILFLGLGFGSLLSAVLLALGFAFGRWAMLVAALADGEMRHWRSHSRCLGMAFASAATGATAVGICSAAWLMTS